MPQYKRKTKRKKSPRWLYPGLLGVLVVLISALVLPNYHQDDGQDMAADLPVYEDVQVASPQVIEPEPKAVMPQAKAKKQYQYHALNEHGIALIIDDVGYDLAALRRVLRLGFPVAISIIPDAPYARQAAEMAHQAGQVVMLHMPMEPANPHYRERMDDSFLRGDMRKEEVQAMLLKGLEKVPYVQGVNNHMGSFLTSKAEPMAWVMAFCKEHDLFFVDSKTSAKSIASDVAARYGLVWGSRRVFLDHSVKKDDLMQAWLSGKHHAKQQGGCMMIGHPHAETLDFLEQEAAYIQSGMMRSVFDLLHVPEA